MFVDPDYTVQALTDIDFRKFKNIDLIFYETRPGEFSLVFSRSVYEAIRARVAIDDPELIPLRDRYLRFMLADKKDEAFEYVRSVSTAAGTMQWLTDVEARENMVTHAEARLKQHSRSDEGLWLLEMLHDDPSPDPRGANDFWDTNGGQNLHARVLGGKDVRFITTVRGHLCWLMSHLIVQNIPEHYTRILHILDRYATEENLYIRVQVAIPLAELVARRRAIKDQDGRPFNWNQDERQRVRDLAFRMLRENSSYPRVMEGLLHVFNSLRDVNEAEAEEILRRFVGTRLDDVLHNLAALFVYFAFFRDAHWLNDPPFDRRRFVEMLKDQIVNGESSIRASIAWHLWKIVQDKQLPYDVVREFFPLFWDGAYDSRAVSMCAIAIEGLSALAPNDAVELFKRMVRKSADHIRKNPGRAQSLPGIEKMVPLLALQPDDLVEVISDLKDLWMNGAYIGDPTTIFASFRHVALGRRKQVKARLQAVYAEMKSANPRFPEVRWED